MADTLDLVAKLWALSQKRAVPFASHRKVALKSDALVLCPVVMAGESATIHAIALGFSGEEAEVWSVPDPRYRDDQYQLFAHVGARIEEYFQRCRANGSFPQLLVSSAGAVAHLDTLAERLRYNKRNAEVRRFGELLSYATERAPVSGQQALLAATGILKEHFATGQPEGEDEHLGALLHWLSPPAKGDFFQLLEEAEAQPVGVSTDPDFDKETLEPRVTAYNAARRRGDSSQTLLPLWYVIHQALAPVVLRIYTAVQRAVQAVQALSLPPLPALSSLEAREAQEFQSFLEAREQGIPLMVRDSAKAATFGLSAREDFWENHQAALLHGDRVERVRGRLSGAVLRGEARNPQKNPTGTRLSQYTFDVQSSQRALHLRLGDELSLLDDPRLRVVVKQISRKGERTTVSLQIVKGERSVGLPGEAQTLELGPAAPDWNRLGRIRGRLKRQLATPPWTHTRESPPAPTPRPVSAPFDLLAALEKLR